MKRWTHHEPLPWALFGAGGFVAALFLPPVIFLVGVLPPADGASLALADTGFGALLLAALIPGCLWHAAHRIHHGLHDLQIPRGRAAWWATYGVAMIGTAIAWLALAAG